MFDQPIVNFAEQVWLERIIAPGPIGSYGDKPSFVQDPQMPGHTRLVNPNLVDDVIDLPLPAAEGLDDPTTRRVGEHLKSISVHMHFNAYLGLSSQDHAKEPSGGGRER